MDLLGFLGLVGDAQQVPLVAHDPGEADPFELVDRLGKFEGIAPGTGADTVEPDVHLDDHAGGDPHPPADRRQWFDLGVMVDGHDGVGLSAERGDPFPLSFSHHHVGDENVADSSRSHHLGFADLGTGDPNRAGGDFHLGNGGAFVALFVRPPLHTVLLAQLSHLPDVVFHPVEVDAQHGGVQVVLVETDQRLRHGGHQAEKGRSTDREKIPGPAKGQIEIGL